MQKPKENTHFLHPSSDYLGAMLGRLGAILGLSWTMLGILGPSWPSWGHLGAILGHLGPSWRHLGAILGHLGAILAPSWAILGHLGSILGPSWVQGALQQEKCEFPRCSIIPGPAECAKRFIICLLKNPPPPNGEHGVLNRSEEI